MVKYLFSFLCTALFLHAASISLTKTQYTPDEVVVAEVSGMLGDGEDWIGIYPQGADNAWENVVSWAWTGGVHEGSVTLDALPAGAYEARVFFQNSFHVEASQAFTVSGAVETTIVTAKRVYRPDEVVVVQVSGMSGNSDDWVGIYPKGAGNAWENVVSWAWTGGVHEGSITLDTLPAGEYEARAFFRNSFHVEARYTFSVEPEVAVEPILYEDAENGMADWIVEEGSRSPSIKSPGYNSSHCVKFPTYWKRDANGHWHNEAEYRLYIEETTNTIFEMDVGGVGQKMPHYFLGVHVTTLQGDRRMFWDSWYNHQGAGPMRYDYGGTVLLFYPSPIELVRGYGYSDVNLWEHFRVDLNQQLQLLEPDNRILTVTAITVSGGYLDNITLSPY